MAYAKVQEDGKIEHTAAKVTSDRKVVNAGYDEIEGVQKVGMMVWDVETLSWVRASSGDLTGTGSSSSISETKRIDDTGSIIYIGVAAPGTVESETGWTIKRIQFDESGNPTAVMLGAGIWSNRVTVNYL
jgi:hypothetical protein